MAQRIGQPRLRDEVLQMEFRSHHEAVAQRNREAPSIRAEGRPDGANIVTGVGFGKLATGGLALAFLLDRAKTAQLEVRFDRGQLHWWAGRLDRLSQAAG
ncbi:hypothetical protein, partial [uncultured Phenylobacterium sp.]|uniref:hypothetical protein n=1 Tax=uncultured Phenylobacterium sp. TaxID=349273 RepID=UPI0025E85A4C